MKDVAFFVTREAGDQQIGPQRFDIIRLLAEELVAKLDKQMDKTPWDAQVNPFQHPTAQLGENRLDADDWANPGPDTHNVEMEPQETW